jgi:hypothetical protein
MLYICVWLHPLRRLVWTTPHSPTTSTPWPRAWSRDSKAGCYMCIFICVYLYVHVYAFPMYTRYIHVAMCKLWICVCFFSDHRSFAWDDLGKVDHFLSIDTHFVSLHLTSSHFISLHLTSLCLPSSLRGVSWADAGPRCGASRDRSIKRLKRGLSIPQVRI